MGAHGKTLRALQIPIERAGHHISSGARDVAVDGTGGHPFMIQLVGLHTWRVARSDHIEVHHAEQGVLRAWQKVGELVHASAIADLSDEDRLEHLAGAAQPRLGFGETVSERLGWCVQTLTRGEQNQLRNSEPSSARKGRRAMPGSRWCHHACHLEEPGRVPHPLTGGRVRTLCTPRPDHCWRIRTTYTRPLPGAPPVTDPDKAPSVVTRWRR